MQLELFFSFLAEYLVGTKCCEIPLAPNYFYFKSGKKLSRQQAMKHKLQRLLGDVFNPELSELENMILAGWIKCADSGNLKFFKEF